MESVSLEKQIAVLKRQVRRMSVDDAKVLLATEQTLNRLLLLRQHVQKADHTDEVEGDALAEELLRLLDLPRADDVVKA
jgi:hypothetical protein